MPLSLLYSKIVQLRRKLYDRGLLRSFPLGAYTVSIGNITTGGTGKTPLVEYTAKLLAKRGEKVCVLTRGYGRRDSSRQVIVSDGERILADPDRSGDEPYELAKKLLGRASVIADADRVAAAATAIREFGTTAFVLDDGFQHLRAKRDLDIVCVDATNPFGGGRTLPSGRLREPVSALKDANIIVITRADLAPDLEGLKREVARLAPNSAIFTSVNRVTGIASLGGSVEGSDRDPSISYFAFCGIGNPESFLHGTEAAGIRLAGQKVFRDHHVYAQTDIDSIDREARAAGAASLLTTAKDAVKLTELQFNLPCFVVEIEAAIDDADAFNAMI